MSSYNMTAFGHANNIFEIYAAVNSGTNGALVYLTLIAIFIIVTISMFNFRNPTKESMMVAGAVTSVISLILFIINIVDYKPMIVFGAIWAIAGIALYLEK